MLNKRTLIAPAALLAAFLISFFWYVLIPQDMQRRLLVFPDTAGGERHREWHLVPDRTDRVEQVRMFVRELELGPVQLGAIPFLPVGTAIRSLMLRDGDVLYLDFTPAVMFEAGTAERSFADVEQLMEENLFHNFRWLREVHFLIGGQVPEAPRFDSIGR